MRHVLDKAELNPLQGWYVSSKTYEDMYLRKDGTVQLKTGYDTDNSGYWKTAEEANNARDKYIDEQLEEKPKQVGGSHYIMPIEPIDYIVKNGLGYREGNVVKYVSRHQKKNGAEDIKKAIHYLEMILKDYEKESK